MTFKSTPCNVHIKTNDPCTAKCFYKHPLGFLYTQLTGTSTTNPGGPQAITHRSWVNKQPGGSKVPLGSSLPWYLIMAIQPTPPPPGPRTPPRNKGFNSRPYQGKPMVTVISPDHKTGYFWGRYVRGGWLTSHNLSFRFWWRLTGMTDGMTFSFLGTA